MNTYLLFKSLHLITVISWMAGLLYLPRIFVYHSENINETISTVFKIMERKLFYYIMTPAMILSWFFGLLLISKIGFDQLTSLWLQLKLILAILLTAYYFDIAKKRFHDFNMSGWYGLLLFIPVLNFIILQGDWPFLISQ